MAKRNGITKFLVSHDAEVKAVEEKFAKQMGRKPKGGELAMLLSIEFGREVKAHNIWDARYEPKRQIKPRKLAAETSPRAQPDALVELNSTLNAILVALNQQTVLLGRMVMLWDSQPTPAVCESAYESHVKPVMQLENSHE